MFYWWSHWSLGRWSNFVQARSCGATFQTQACLSAKSLLAPQCLNFSPTICFVTLFLALVFYGTLYLLWSIECIICIAHWEHNVVLFIDSSFFYMCVLYSLLQLDSSTVKHKKTTISDTIWLVLRKVLNFSEMISILNVL